MNKRIRIQITRPAPVLTLKRLAMLSHEEVLRLTSNFRVRRKMEYGLAPYYFAQTKKGVLVFTSPYRTLLERLEVIGESKRMFKDIPVSFDSTGMPCVVADHQPAASPETPSPQLLLRLAE